MTAAGRTYLVLTVGVGLGALNTGNNLLYLVLGLLLSLIVVSGVLSERCLRGLRVHRLGCEAGAFAEERASLRWHVEQRRYPAYALAVSEATAPWEAEGFVPVVVPGTPGVARADLVAPRRGAYALRAIRVTTTYPLGLFAKSRLFDVEDTIWVYPRRRPAAGRAPAADAQAHSDAGTPGRGHGAGDIYGLTELREGEDARRVHWLRSASAGTLLRVEREREERRTVTLRVVEQGSIDAVDRACEEAAALARDLLARGYDVGLDAGATRLRPAAGATQEQRILRALATVGYAGTS